MSSSRYYESTSEIRPGKISQELRDACQIPQNDLPIWIYRMRALGYPPGWLKKAVVDTNDIFDTEEAEATDQGSKKRKNSNNDCIQYDHSKLIEYPGFNAPMPEGCVDYHYYVNMPAMLQHQQLEYAKKHMSSFTPVPVPKRTRISGTSLNESTDISTPEPQDPESPATDESSDTSGANVTATSNGGLDSSKDEIKLVSKGSPMPKPVQRASLEKFSEGVVGELLYFENIPSSTKRFESIRGLLKKPS